MSDDHREDSHTYFNTFKARFEKEHFADLRQLEPIALPEHVASSNISKIYRGSKYRVTLSKAAFSNLIQFLESKDKEGGVLIISILQSHLNLNTVERGADEQYSLSNQLQRAKEPEDYPAEDEGIPGHNPGSANLEQSSGSTVLTRLKLGPLPMEQDLKGDVEAELREEDLRIPPVEGQSSLSQHFEDYIKQEEGEDAPTRAEIPQPQSLARDVKMEVQKVKEYRDRFRIDGRTGGIGPGVSVVMYTFHNTHDR